MEIDENKIREQQKKRLNMAVNWLKYKGIVKTQQEIASKMGAGRGNISSALSGKKEYLTDKFLIRFHDTFPEISFTWLMSDEGKMVVEDTEIKKTVDEMRPRLPMNVSKHGIYEYLGGTKRYMCDERPIIKQFPEYDFTLVLNDDSMAPRYWNGDEIALKRREALNNIEWGHEYVIDTMRLGPRLKMIYENGSNFLLRSYDMVRYPDFLVPKSEVYAIYRVVGMIRM
jgi:hypothetical protein